MKSFRSLKRVSRSGWRADRGQTVSLWMWLLIGSGGFFLVSLVVGLAVAAILANLGREVSNVGVEPWASSPLTRARDASAGGHAATAARGRTAGHG